MLPAFEESPTTEPEYPTKKLRQKAREGTKVPSQPLLHLQPEPETHTHTHNKKVIKKQVVNRENKYCWSNIIKTIFN
jgi:hypothetical protein